MDPNLHHQPYPVQYQQPVAGVPYRKSWHIVKIVFTSVSMVLCIIVIGTSIALAVDPDILSFALIWTVPQASVSLIWSIAELITICARSGHRGIHPGAHVALHLLLWLGFIVGLGLTGYLLTFATLYGDYYDYYEYYGNNYVELMRALTSFLALLVIVHFFLFVRACVETAQRNRVGGAPPVMMVPQPMYYQAPPMQPAYPIQQQQQQQQQMQPGYPTQPPPTHLSGYYGQPNEVQQHITGSSTGHGHFSQPPPSGTPVEDDGLQPVTAQK
ncbi:hypothetical protein F5X96DRAFT_321593 [Biscogniauxia mediterranea]|nr:hypothetical protein F5X96DRAFT_321593 [Biscogniauxia mediterranea]